MNIDENLVREISANLSNNVPIFFSCSALEINFEVKAEIFADGCLTLVNTIPPEYISRVVNSPDLFIQIGMLKFKTHKIRSDGQNIVFPIETGMQIKQVRSEERQHVLPTQKVHCIILNPFDQRTQLRKDVVEMTNAGLSVRMKYDSELFAIDRQLPVIKVFVNGEFAHEHRGVVVYKRKLMNPRGRISTQVGIRFATT